MSDFIKGMDISSLVEVENCGGRFYDNGKEGDAVDILKSYGMNLARLRLWNDPYSADGVSYGAGGNDLPRTMEMAKRVQEAGIGWILNLHYSDFWADPGKQTIPKAWQGMHLEEMARALYEFTATVIKTLAADGLQI